MPEPRIIPVDPDNLTSLTFTVEGVDYVVGVQHGDIAVRRITDTTDEQLFRYEIPEIADSGE